MTTLREAAQQAVVMLKTGMPEYNTDDVLEVLEAALAEPAQEPVAFAHINGTSDTKWHPPQRKPLTDEEIAELTKSYPASSMWRLIVSTARAIERAHGIT